MLQIRNVTRGTAYERRVSLGTKFNGSSGFPLYFNLGPGEQTMFPKQNMIDWHPSVKQNLAEYVAQGFLKVYDLNSSHVHVDKGNNPQYDLSYLLPANQALALEHALTFATALGVSINGHVQSVAIHNAATAVIAAAAPTNLATLIVWIAAAQTAYETVHRPNVPAHPHVDTVNTLVPVVAADLATSIAALTELYSRYVSHKTWVVGTAELDVQTIAAY